jgi:hypothetical protein
MRLLRIKDDDGLSLTTFFSSNIPPYAILSHTWEADDQELTIQDVINETGEDKTGYRKIQFCRDQAKRDGLQYFWVDSCCIDKSSSSELTEAINSMFQWYENSARCYAYLQDMVWSSPVDSSEQQDVQDEALRQELKQSRWFTRGWTLQELLAPDEVYFYNGTWSPIGTRTTLYSYIAQITTIEQDMLQLRRSPYTSSRISIQTLLADKSVAQRMSWAAHRSTSCPEDLAYCLLGLFDVNMPLIYGEGLRKAFFRLQTEILRDSTDQTLLAWSPETSATSWVGALAVHPKDFASGGNIVTVPARELSFEISNRGLRLKMQVIRKSNATFAGVLACHEEDDFSSLLAIPLLQDMSSLGSNERGFIQDSQVFLRNQNLPVEKVNFQDVGNVPWKMVYLATKSIMYPPDAMPRHFVLQSLPAGTDVVINAVPTNRWNDTTRTIQFRDTKLKDRRGALALSMKYFNSTLSFGMVFGVKIDEGQQHHPFIRLHHGPPTGTTVESWLEELMQLLPPTTAQTEDSLVFLDRVLRVQICADNIFGKMVYVINAAVRLMDGKAFLMRSTSGKMVEMR